MSIRRVAASTFLLTAGGCLLLAGPVAAAVQQGAPDAAVPRAGLWLSAGAGAGIRSEAGAGFGAYVRMGGTLSRNLLLGGEVIGIFDPGPSADVTLGNATVVAVFDPAERGGLLWKGGIGLASFTTRVDELDVTGDDQGVGITLGAAYDVALGTNLWLTANLDVLVQSFDGFADSSVIMATVGLGMH
jgi:hypothetical protein